jgi:hypothetical protein
MANGAKAPFFLKKSTSSGFSLYRTEVPLIGATDKELRADGNIYAGAIPGCFIIELLAQLAHQLAP